MTILNIPIKFHYSMLFLIALVVFQAGVVSGLIISTIVYLTILMHELAHIKTAEQYGMLTSNITLHGLGGVANIDVSFDKISPKREIIISLMGPISNFIAAILIYFIAYTFNINMQDMENGPNLDFAITYLYLVNVVLGIFNMLPAFPMDGGRILKAFLTIMLKDKDKATKYSIAVALVFATLFVIYGVIVGAIALTFIGIILWITGASHLLKISEIN